MTKRVLSLVLTALMLFSIMPVSATQSSAVAGVSGSASGYDGSYGGVAGGVAGGAVVVPGGSSSAGGVTDGYTISGQLVFGDEVVLENGLLDGFIAVSVYEDGKTDFLPGNGGEGDYSYSFYNKEDYTFSITVPKDVGKVTIAALVYPYRGEESEGEFRTNILGGHIYYIGDCQSTTDSSMSEIITVDGDISGIQIPVQTGVECYFNAIAPNDNTAYYWVDMALKTAEDEIIERASLRMDGGYGKGGIVLNKNLIGEEFYLEYNLSATNTQYYEDAIYVNPNGTYSLTLEDAKPFTISEEVQNISFNLAKKSEFMKTLKGNIGFAEGCDLKSEGFYGSVYAVNKVTGQRYSYHFSGNSTEGTTYTINVPASSNEYYFYADMWVGDGSSNVSPGTYYYSSEGMVFSVDDATLFTLDNAPEYIDFTYAKKASISGKLVADGEIINKENIEFTAYINSETDYCSGISVKCDENLNYSIDVPASVSGKTSMYIYVDTGTNVLTNTQYYYVSPDGDEYFNIVPGQDVGNIDIKVSLGDVLKGKIKLPDDGVVSSGITYEIGVLREGQNYSSFQQSVEIPKGETEAEFVFALPNNSTQKYMLSASGYTNGTTNIYTDNIYYVSDTQSSENRNDATAFSLAEKNDITFMALTGAKANISVKNSYGAYIGGYYYIEFEDGKTLKEYYSLSNEATQNFYKVLSNAYVGKKAYLYYDINTAVKVYVNPDGTLINKRALAKMHTFKGGETFALEISSDKSLYTIPSIKGTVSLPENGYIRDEYESEPYITSSFTLYDENWNYKDDKNAWIYPNRNGSFEFSMGETGNYYLSMRVSTYYYATETNVVTSDTLYYSSEKGWTTKKEEATLLSNLGGEVNLNLELPLSTCISGTITFPSDAYVEGKAECRIEITKADTGTKYSEYVYFTDTEDIDFSVKGGFGCEEYYISFEFSEEYFSECETNIELDRIYYYSKDGLTVDETQKVIVKPTDSIIAEAPVKPTIKGKVNLPENAVISEGLQAYVELCDENGYRKDSKYYTIGKDGFEFSLCGQNGIDKYTLEAYVSSSEETNLETNTYLYYTSKGFTASSSEKEYFLLSELDEKPIVLTLPKTRTVSGKIIIEDFEGEKPEQVVVHIQSETYGTTITADLDENFCFSVKVPGGMQGSSTMYVRFEDSLKNNIIKNEEFYYTNGGQYSASFMLEMNKDVENLNVVAETGNVVSGTLILPEDAIFTGAGDLYCDVGMGYYANYRVTLTEQQRSGDFWLVVPKSVGSSSLYASPTGNASTRCSNLYTYDDVFYVSDTESTIYGAKATSLKFNKENKNLKLHLQTGTPYTVNFMKDADITNAEKVSLYIGDFYTSVTLQSNVTAGTAKIIVPDECVGEEMYLYYELSDEVDNGLYRERVYINEDGTLTGSRKLADTYKIDGTSREFDVTLAQYSDLEMPEYIMCSPYPYKNNTENLYYYKYDGNEDVDYLKVTFAEETYFPTGDYVYIYYGDNQTMGPYRTTSLAGETVNVPGDNFKIAILGSYTYNAFGFAIESIEPKKYTLESAHPYVSVEYPYTHKTDADGLRLHFSEDTAFSGYMTVKYTHNGKEESKTYYSGNLAGRSIDVRGNEFTITLPENTSGSYYGFTIVEIEEIEYFDVTFKNYDGTELYRAEVEKGKTAYYYEDEPERERDEDYIYIFEGWDKSLQNITEDTVVTAQFSENEYYTVDFKAEENGEVLYTDYVLTYDDWAEYDCETLPVKTSTETKGYIFKGWDIDLFDIKSDCTAIAKFEEKDILCQSEHPYNSQGVLEYNYEYMGNADSIMLVFSSDTYLSAGDRLYIYNENEDGTWYSTDELFSEGIVVTGRKVKFVIDCYGEGGAFGFALVDVIPMWHNFTAWEHDWYNAPTCTEVGYEYRECNNCYTYEEREIPALGHSYSAWEKDLDGTIFRECIRCAEREVFDGELSNCGIVNINVVDAVTMEPLEDVTLTAYDENGNETVWNTNRDGVASQMLNKGINNLVVFLDGYIMRNISLDVIAGVTDVPVIGLTEKPAVECKLEAKLMDMEEIKAAGIDTTDPLNSQVYKYKINLGFGEPKDVYFNKAGDYIHRDGNLVVIHEATGTSATIHPVNDKYFLVIYGQSKWLKEMFDVELVAVNTSNTDTVENLVAELKIPDGMSLAAMNRAPQSDVQRMGSLASGESKSVHWYVRGDEEGEYNLSAKLTGTLMPFGEQFGYEYTTDEPIKVYAGSALQMNLIVPAVATYGEDYTVRIEIENVSDRSVYNLSNSVDKVLQSKFLSVDKDGYEKYFEENAVGYIAVDELKPGEKIVAEIKSNILFESDVIKDKIGTLANRLQSETDILAIFNSYKATLDLLNDNYDIIYNALGNVTRSKTHLTGEQLSLTEALEKVLSDCEKLVKTEASSRAMYFINRLKQENTFEELTKLSKDANYYTVWSNERINKLCEEINALYEEAKDPENCADYDIYEDIKKTLRIFPVDFWLRDIFVSKLEGSTTEIPYTVTVIPSEESYTGVTNISNYYYNIFSRAIETINQPWYAEIMGEIRDKEGASGAYELIKADRDENVVFEVTDVTGDTRFNAWVEGESGATFEISSTAENVGVTEGGITFTGPAYLFVTPTSTGKGTLHIEEVSNIATFSAEKKEYTFEIEAGEEHNCNAEKWTEIVTAYDDNDGYYAKYCDICGELIDMKTVKATNDCSSGSYEVTNEKITDTGYSCTLTFDEETPARSAVAVVVMRDENGKAVATVTDAIKIKPESTVQVEIPLKNSEGLQPKVLLWDSLSRLRPVGSK